MNIHDSDFDQNVVVLVGLVLWGVVAYVLYGG